MSKQRLAEIHRFSTEREDNYGIGSSHVDVLQSLLFM